jgi:hypothetical protein
MDVTELVGPEPTDFALGEREPIYSMWNRAKRHGDAMRSSSCAARHLEYCLARELSDFSHGALSMPSIRVSL